MTGVVKMEPVASKLPPVGASYQLIGFPAEADRLTVPVPQRCELVVDGGEVVVIEMFSGTRALGHVGPASA